ncbi:hypothetical protein EIP75_04900 [Aquabacterium soli]|uniref:4-amino-4-deoxy-L-arabinose transferase n=1 Tax=Aquabacterium soli TaxID=2493092 RepID=A0A426VF53_9BURK|nr:hypothetical protein [Aquabacterium soli]RRS05548.1 hypothetical protein EIP75_04900 [Aquabacterium soli]
MQADNQAHVTPALVTEKAVRRLPRWALWAFCAAYVLPGLFGRDPWKNADIASFGQMWSLALGQASWWAPHVGGVSPGSGGILPYWLGGGFIAVLSPIMDPAFAARVPFALLLGAVLALTWYTTYHLARTDAAQPLPLAFGGEAPAADYARALADGALLALVATLGLLQMGHETTPELLQLTGSALFMYGLAAAPLRHLKARLATVGSLALLATSGSPTVAMMLAGVGVLVCWQSQEEGMRRYGLWVIGAGVIAAALATVLTLAQLSGWNWKVGHEIEPGQLVKLIIWFTWPALPLAALTVWKWRRQWLRRHIAVPLCSALVGIAACIAMSSSDRALLHSLPPLAVLAAFALPALKRGLSGAIDWFSVFFFTIAALAIWLVYAAMHTGWPAKTAANVAKLVPGYTAEVSWVALGFAMLGTLAWLLLVRWRTARHRAALWKSLVLPAGGVALVWLLLMSLLLPVLDQARSYRLLLDRVATHVQPGQCVLAPNASVGLLTALEYFGKHTVYGQTGVERYPPAGCQWLMISLSARQDEPSPPGWTFVSRERQRTQNSESVAIYRRHP